MFSFFAKSLETKEYSRQKCSAECPCPVEYNLCKMADEVRSPEKKRRKTEKTPPERKDESNTQFLEVDEIGKILYPWFWDSVSSKSV